MTVASFHTQVRLFGYDLPDLQMTVLLSGSPTVANIGAAVTQDTSAANTFKLCGAGDPVHGILNQVEVRSVEGTVIGTVGLNFMDKLNVDAGLTGQHVVAIGSLLEGSATAGTVRAIDQTADAVTLAAMSHIGNAPRVFEVIGTTAVALKVGL